MSEPSKDNAQIAADHQAFLDAFDRARAFFSTFDGVEGVGYGHKESGGRFSDDVCITVFVREKKDEDEVPPDQRIPPRFEGYRTDVRTVPRRVPSACDNDTKYDKIQGGIQIGVAKSTDIGTLGCIVRKRGDSGRENVYVLSNKHVLYAGDTGAKDYAFHPRRPPPPGFQYEGNPPTPVALGPVQELSSYSDQQATVPNGSNPPVTDQFFVDAAIARLEIDSKCGTSTCTQDKTEYDTAIVDLQLNGVNTLSGVRSIARDLSIVVPTATPASDPSVPKVFKVGRTTGRTRGVVRGVFTTVNLSAIGHFPATTGHNVIEVEFSPDPALSPTNCRGRTWFSEKGDSGSLLVDEAGNAIGLMHAGPDPADTSTPANSTSTACHILPVLQKLGICIPTTGNSHGSCAATDGSGTAPAAAAGSGGTAGELRVAMAAPLPPPELTNPVPVGAEQQARLFALRDTFRESAKGRELHALFGMVRREVAYLVRNVRPVKVAWHRAEGPAYFAHVLNHLRGDAAGIPLRVNGVTRGTLLERMAAVLAAHGSNPLREGIARWRDELMPILSTAATVDECLARFRQAEEDAGAPGAASTSAPDLVAAAAAEGEAP